jgi:hypothetical protein
MLISGSFHSLFLIPRGSHFPSDVQHPQSPLNWLLNGKDRMRIPARAILDVFGVERNRIACSRQILPPQMASERIARGWPSGNISHLRASIETAENVRQPCFVQCAHIPIRGVNCIDLYLRTG